MVEGTLVLNDTSDRYSRQLLLPEIGPAGQARLAGATVLLVGCGALGTLQAELLVRAGVGRLRIADRDLVERTNLQRQLLFDEEDAAARLPKAEAAARRLRRINSSVLVEALVTDVSPHNAKRLVEEVTLVCDGTDNFETRYVLNDACVELGRPWVYGGAVGTGGMTMSIVPGEGPCLRCFFPDPPPPASVARCDTHGVLGPATALVASLQAAAALRLLVGCHDGIGELLHLDAWHGRFGRIAIQRQPECPCCGKRSFEFLQLQHTSRVNSLCGSDSVQVTPPPGSEDAFSLEDLRHTLEPLLPVDASAFMLRFTVEGCELTVFQDGRAIVSGTSDEGRARALYSRWVGL